MSEAPARIESRIPWPVRVLLAPLHALERARGYRRIALISLYGLLLIAGVALLWRAASIRDLPDIGEPFDTTALRAIEPPPDDRNAWTLYREAAGALHRDSGVENRLFRSPPAWPAPTDEQAHAYLRQNARALEVWRRATERPAALLARPRDLEFDTSLAVLNEHRILSRLALVMAAGRRAASDVEGAWGWYRATLRASRHAGRHAPVVGRLVGIGELGSAVPEVLAWAEDPAVGVPLLRRALADVETLDALTGPASEAYAVDYLSFAKSLRKPDSLRAAFVAERNQVDMWTHLPGLWSAAFWLGNEPERTRLLGQLVFANWMRHIDDPPSARPPLLAGPGDIELFDDPDAGPLPPDELQARLRESFFTPWMLRQFLIFGSFVRQLDRERADLARLRLGLAEQIYLRERGAPPARFADLVSAGILGALPVGVDPDDTPVTDQLRQGIPEP
jgi:hypothetical protein